MSEDRNRLFEILEPAGAGDRVSRAWDWFMIGLILSNVALAVIVSIDTLAHHYERLFELFEVITVFIFTLEFFVRLWACPSCRSGRYSGAIAGRLRFSCSPYSIIDILAFAPFFLILVFPVETHIAHVIPLLRTLKLLRYSPAIETLATVLYNERKALIGAAIIMVILLLFSSSLLYLVEREAQPQAFANIPDSMWWGIATLTTVGYGDVTPITPLGKLIGSIVTVLGIAMFALPAGILATGFGQEIRQRDFLVTWNLVAGVPMFSDLNALEIAHIAKQLVPRVVQANQVIVRKGDAAEGMFFIVSGSLDVELHGRRQPLDEAIFGEIALLEHQTRLATVTARTRAQLLVLHAKQFEAFLDSQPDIAATIRRVAKERLDSRQ